ncbi:hypothetical protein OESDEN_16537, partial [Oesophagostomum dentatum]
LRTLFCFYVICLKPVLFRILPNDDQKEVTTPFICHSAMYSMYFKFTFLITTFTCIGMEREGSE